MAYERKSARAGRGKPVVAEVTDDWSGTATGEVAFWREQHLDELVRHASEHGLYDSTSEPRDTR